MEYFLIYYIPFVLSLLLLLFSLRKTNSRMWSGFLFYVCVFSLGGALAFTVLPFSSHPAVYVLLLAVAAVLALILIFGIYILLAFLFVNTAVIVKRENRSLAHMLTLVLAVLIIVYMVLGWAVSTVSLPVWAQSLWNGFGAALGYFIFHIFVFLSTLLVGNIFRPRRRVDYIIVLGSGLIDGKAPPLLQKRIGAAMRFGQKQAKRKGDFPYLVMSGGQGTDEPCPEAVAMKAYAAGQGYPEDRILTEEESTTTEENFAFSRKLMDIHADGKTYRCIFATSSYHLYRAGLYARRVGLLIRGLGAKTAFYYLPNAVLREYIAYLVMRKRRFIIIGVLIFFLVCGGNFFSGQFLG